MAEMKPSQERMILEWLESGKTITGPEALREFGCARLAARICDLRDKGIEIKTRSKKVKTRHGSTTVAEYYMEGKQQ